MNAEFALARVEGTRLLRNPLVWLAVIPSALWVNSAKAALDRREAENIIHLFTGYAVLLPGFATLIVTILAVLRSRLANADELLDTLPVTRAQRSVAHGWSTAANALYGAVIIAAAYLYLRPSSRPGLYPEAAPPVFEAPRPNIAQMLQGPVALAAVAAGVIALVRWIPTWLVAVPLFFSLAVQGLFFGTYNGVSTSWVTWLWPLSNGIVQDGWIDSGCGTATGTCQLLLTGFDRTTPWWHLGYLLALGVWSVTIAVLRHRRDMLAWTAFAVSLVATIGFALIQAAVYTRPL